jgi:hypothetical protein
VPAVVVEELPSARAEKRKDVLEVRRGARGSAKCGRIEGAATRGEEEHAGDTAADLEPTRLEVSVRKAVARDVENRSQKECCEPRAAGGAGRSACREVEGDYHGCLRSRIDDAAVALELRRGGLCRLRRYDRRLELLHFMGLDRSRDVGTGAQPQPRHDVLLAGTGDNCRGRHPRGWRRLVDVLDSGLADPARCVLEALRVNSQKNRSRPIALSWAASTGATSYEWCVSSTSGACAPWTSKSGTSASVGGLAARTQYFWQVRARNANGTTNANGGSWCSFRIR